MSQGRVCFPGAAPNETAEYPGYSNSDSTFYASMTFKQQPEGVAEAVIDAPAGWTAVLGETTLTVKAPATFDAASQQAAVSVTVYSDRKYRKLVTLNVTLLDEPGGCQRRSGMAEF